MDLTLKRKVSTLCTFINKNLSESTSAFCLEPLLISKHLLIPGTMGFIKDTFVIITTFIITKVL